MATFLTSKKSAYSKEDDPSVSREDRIARLKTELREHIRFLSDYEPMSTDWLRMAESMHQIANVAFMETSMSLTEAGAAQSEPALLQAGKKASGTLWDQEKDELAVRILLEEGKLNLVLRVLHRYCEATRQPDWNDLVAATAAKYKSEVKTVSDRCRIFEQSVGILLKYVMQHIEALQIIDQPEFIVHASQLFKYAVDAPASVDGSLDFDKMQECLVIYCFASLTGQFEELDEERIMDLMEENQTISLFTNYLANCYTRHSVATLIQATQALNSIVASDPFQAERARFLPSDLHKQFLSLKGLFVSELVSKFGIKRTSIQHLLDEFARIEKVQGPVTVTPLTVRGSNKGAEEQKEN